MLDTVQGLSYIYHLTFCKTDTSTGLHRNYVWLHQKWKGHSMSSYYMDAQTWCMLNSASVAEYRGYCGMGTITPLFFPLTSFTSSFKTDWEKNQRRQHSISWRVQWLVIDWTITCSVISKWLDDQKHIEVGKWILIWNTDTSWLMQFQIYAILKSKREI